jgi:hypothetical protein
LVNEILDLKLASRISPQIARNGGKKECRETGLRSPVKLKPFPELFIEHPLWQEPVQPT